MDEGRLLVYGYKRQLSGKLTHKGFRWATRIDPKRAFNSRVANLGHCDKICEFCLEKFLKRYDWSSKASSSRRN